jgi:hypothetical protein
MGASSQRALEEQLAEERLRDAARDLLRELKSVNCPGGGWTGMPIYIEPTVDNCIAAGTCGCSHGAAVKKAEGKP